MFFFSYIVICIGELYLHINFLNYVFFDFLCVFISNRYSIFFCISNSIFSQIYSDIPKAYFNLLDFAPMHRNLAILF